MKKGWKTKLAVVVAATAGFLAGKWAGESKDKIAARYKNKSAEERPHPYSEQLEGEVALDEYELQAYHD